jgi:hypothetical protein
VVVANNARWEIRVRSGRDDKGRAVTHRRVSDLDGQGHERLLCEDRKSLRYLPPVLTHPLTCRDRAGSLRGLLPGER